MKNYSMSLVLALIIFATSCKSINRESSEVNQIETKCQGRKANTKVDLLATSAGVPNTGGKSSGFSFSKVCEQEKGNTAFLFGVVWDTQLVTSEEVEAIRSYEQMKFEGLILDTRIYPKARANFEAGMMNFYNQGLSLEDWKFYNCKIVPLLAKKTEAGQIRASLFAAAYFAKMNVRDILEVSSTLSQATINATDAEYRAGCGQVIAPQATCAGLNQSACAAAGSGCKWVPEVPGIIEAECKKAP